MKKSKLFVASVIVSLSLLSVPSIAGPTTLPPPAEERISEGSFSDWFFGLFDF